MSQVKLTGGQGEANFHGNPEIIHVFIEKQPDGPIFTMECNIKDTIQQIKEEFENVKGIPQQDQLLFLEGALLDDPHTLSDYDIQHGAVIQMIVAKISASSIGDTESHAAADDHEMGNNEKPGLDQLNHNYAATFQPELSCSNEAKNDEIERPLSDLLEEMLLNYLDFESLRLIPIKIEEEDEENGPVENRLWFESVAQLDLPEDAMEVEQPEQEDSIAPFVKTRKKRRRGNRWTVPKTKKWGAIPEERRKKYTRSATLKRKAKKGGAD